MDLTIGRFPVSGGQRFVLDVCKIPSARGSEDFVPSAPKSWETLCFSEDGKMSMESDHFAGDWSLFEKKCLFHI